MEASWKTESISPQMPGTESFLRSSWLSVCTGDCLTCGVFLAGCSVLHPLTTLWQDIHPVTSVPALACFSICYQEQSRVPMGPLRWEPCHDLTGLNSHCACPEDAMNTFISRFGLLSPALQVQFLALSQG